MPMIITFTPDIEQALTAEAHKLGRAPEQLALESLRARFLAPRSDGPSRGTGHPGRLPPWASRRLAQQRTRPRWGTII